jgi:hypothetical protein
VVVRRIDVESRVVSNPNPGETAASGLRIALMVALVGVVFWTLLVVFLARARYAGDVRGLLCVGENFCLPAAFEAVPRSSPAGYDGQQYAALATDPFLREFDTTKAFDAPAYRAGRILVPLLAWLLVLGHAGPAIIAYQLLCWGLGLAAVFLVANWLAAEGHSPWWALPLVCSAGLAAAMIRSMPDAAALALMLAALFLHARGRFVPALVTCVAAVLAREVLYLSALAIAIEELRRRRMARAAAFVAIPLVPLAAWHLYLRGVLGPPRPSTIRTFGTPFSWVPQKLSAVLAASPISWQEVFGLLAIAATAVALVLVASRPTAWAAPELTFLAFGALGALLTDGAYVETWGYARHLIAMPFLGSLVAERQRSPWRRWPLRLVAFFYLLAGLMMTGSELTSAIGGRSLLAAVRGTPTAAEAPCPSGDVRSLYVLPVANSKGRAGARWQTWLEVTNLGPSGNTVCIELLRAGRAGSSALRTTVVLEQGQTKTWQSALDQLFGYSGSGALRLSPLSGPISVSSRTANIAAGTAETPLVQATGEESAIRNGEKAIFRGLSHDPSHQEAVRTNIGLLNLAAGRIRVRITLYDALVRRLGHLEGNVPSRGFLQVDDIFAQVRAGAVSDGSAVVETITPGGEFLAYAAVIRGPAAPVLYVSPEPNRPPAASSPK